MAESLFTRLTKGDYKAVTDDECEFLTRILNAAPYLFLHDSTLGNKRTSDTPDAGRSAKKAKSKTEKLNESYYPEGFVSLLEEKREGWESDPKSFFGELEIQSDDTDGSAASIFSFAVRLDISTTFTDRQKRLVHVALALLHEPYTHVDAIWSRIQESRIAKTLQKQHPQHFSKNRLRTVLKYGRKWWIIAHLCAKLDQRSHRPHENCSHVLDCPHSGLCESDDECAGRGCDLSGECFFHPPHVVQRMIGVILLLDQGYSWEAAKYDQCEAALACLGVRTDLFKRAKANSGVVQAILKMLKGGATFPHHDNEEPTRAPSSLQSRPEIPTPEQARFQVPGAVQQTRPPIHALSDADHASGIVSGLLLFLHFLVGPDLKVEIPLLTFIGYQRKRWKEDGDQEMYTALEHGLSEELHKLFQGEHKLEGALRTLHRQGYIEFVSDYQAIQLRRHVEKFLLDADTQSYWKDQVLRAICYLFTGNANSKEFSRVGCLALPYFERLMNSSMSEMPPSTRDLMVEALVTSSSFSTLEWKERALERIEHITTKSGHTLDTSTELLILVRKSFVHRMKKQPNCSIQLIEPHLRNIEDISNRKMHVMIGKLHLELGYAFHERGEFNKAQCILQSWPYKSCVHEDINLSLFELSIMRKIAEARGWVSTCAKDFQAAENSLTIALTYYPEGEPISYRSRSLLAGIYCEQGRSSDAVSLLKKHVACSMERLDYRPYRELLVSYTEVLVCANEFDEAAKYLPKLSEYFDGNSNPLEQKKKRLKATGVLGVKHLNRVLISGFMVWERIVFDMLRKS
ncbi:hypothetical protein NA57DRAFT_52790 [Rhizodiscina lignyota]|uniref:Uncharacterized protein n=1 Tax=Rhizodiscina lignyota TaxID=1504668 RepID=A0A9P4IRN7_9PEZI|nr:hypothetical protein NA57DRAFT_52790 [Rhizodiscina lignyota]